MRRIENECCECAVPSYPCMGESCPKRHMIHFYCDLCGAVIDPHEGLFEEGGEDVCLDCLKESHRKDFE